jgi:uncharacterized protein
VVDDPGSLNFNGLNTRDIEGAKAFYGSVFGGRTFAMDGGLEMWALDGYGDFIERHHPDLRKRWAEAGAPPGFEDVVATIDRIGDDQRDTPPHWSVTFAVDDADTAAATATQLGGTVLVPPFDAPWVRMTILADPQGATLHREQVHAGECRRVDVVQGASEISDAVAPAHRKEAGGGVLLLAISKGAPS